MKEIAALVDIKKYPDFQNSFSNRFNLLRFIYTGDLATFTTLSLAKNAAVATATNLGS